MIKVLLAAPKGNVTGGISRWTRHVMSYYSTHGNDGVRLELCDMARSEYVGDDAGIFKRIVPALKDYRKLLREYRAAVKRGKYDVVHITSSASLGLIRDLCLIRMAHKCGAKAIIHFRFGRTPELSQQRNWEWKLLKKVVRSSDISIFIDERSYRAIKDAGLNNVELLPNPIAPATLKVINGKKLINDSDKHGLLFVGHCIKTKGIFELVEACKEIANIRVKMIGAVEDDVRKQLKQRAGGGDWLDIVGEMPYEDVINEMMQCSVFVLPTYTEGFPNVILEAMACGCPIVTTDVGAIPEMLDIEDGQYYGICVKPKDVKELRKAVFKMLDDRRYAENCGNNARKRVNDLYSMPKVWARMVEIWKDAARNYPDL